mgnify:CR=1 FL=1
MFDEYPDVVGINELCIMLGRSSKKLAYRYLRNKSIPSIRIGREYKIAKADVIKFVLNHGKSSDCL